MQIGPQMKIGNWTVVEYSHHVGPQSRKMWKCVCICGTVRNVRQDVLQRDAKGCGCKHAPYPRLKPSRSLPYGEANFNALLNQYKQSARRKGIDFLLTSDEFRALTKGDCVYCGDPPAQKYQNAKTKFTNGPCIYNGVDRVDSLQGYTVENTVSACGVCNRMKMAHDVKDFLVQVEKIYKKCFP